MEKTELMAKLIITKVNKHLGKQLKENNYKDLYYKDYMTNEEIIKL